jgi:hypothetical protein
VDLAIIGRLRMAAVGRATRALAAGLPITLATCGATRGAAAFSLIEAS